LAACLVGGVLTACSGAPPEGGADYEIESSGPRTPASSSETSDADDDAFGDSASAEEDEGAPATRSNPPADEGDPDEAPAPVPEAPAPTKVTAKVGGVTLTVTDTTLWSEVSGPGKYSIFVKVTGPGIAAGSDFHVSATRTGPGCESGGNFITYRPQNDTQYMPKATPCGLKIDELPTAVGGRFRGTFVGTLTGINTTTTKTKNITLAFDVLRTK
jgi:hypothetical protein